MATNIFAITDTYQLMSTVENIQKPTNYLADTFFPNAFPFFYTTQIAVEYRQEGRLLAPYVVSGSRGVNINRGTSSVMYFSAPMFGARRVISLRDVEQRQFGETPIFSTKLPEQRAAAMQAQDLVDLLRLHANRKEKVAADILQYGKTTMNAYADDGRIVESEVIDYGWDGRISTDWTASTADIYGDIRAVSDRIQRRTGTIPTVAICGKGVEDLLMKNTVIHDWLLVPNRQNLTMASFAPHYTSPQCRYIGTISALNMEFVSYGATFIDDDGQTKPFIDDYSVIIANSGKGKILRGAITLMEDTGYKTYASDYVPRYTLDKEANQMSLAVFARYILVPELLDDYVCLTVKP